MDSKKVMSDVGLGAKAKADNPSAISTVLVRKVYDKCHPLRIDFDHTAVANLNKEGWGQGGLIRRDPLSSSPGGNTIYKFSVLPVTAKHNLRRVGYFHTSQATLKVHNSALKVDSADMDWVPTIADQLNLLRDGLSATRPSCCPWGINISVGTLISEQQHPATMPAFSFE